MATPNLTPTERHQKRLEAQSERLKVGLLSRENTALIATWRFLIAGRIIILIGASTFTGTVVNAYRTHFIYAESATIEGMSGKILLSTRPGILTLIGFTILISLFVAAALRMDRLMRDVMIDVMDRGKENEISLSLIGGFWHIMKSHWKDTNHMFMTVRIVYGIISIGWIVTLWSTRFMAR